MDGGRLYAVVWQQRGAVLRLRGWVELKPWPPRRRRSRRQHLHTSTACIVSTTCNMLITEIAHTTHANRRLHL